jgi:hypothetical protein
LFSSEVLCLLPWSPVPVRGPFFPGHFPPVASLLPWILFSPLLSCVDWLPLLSSILVSARPVLISFGQVQLLDSAA